jgi:hypothetical membrane protein
MANNKSGCISVLGNVIWIIFGGLFTAISWLLLGVLLCITIIGIPFGKQCFKFAGLTLAPFGREVAVNFSKHPVMNIIWLVLFGWEMFLGYLTSAVLLCITIIGIPFGVQIFKISVLALFPFGAEVR